MSKQISSGNMQVSVAPGTQYAADSAGVMVVADNTAIFGLTPLSASFSANGGNGNVTVSSLGPTLWTAVSQVPWITVSMGTGSGSGSFGYVVSANTSSSSRTGTITVAGLTLTVKQAGMSCQPSLSSTALNVGAGLTTGSITVSAQAGCAWTATSQAPWISISSGASGTGNGSVVYNIAANISSSARNGTLTIAGITVNVTQAGTGGNNCTYTVSIVRKLMTAATSTKSVVVTTQTGCAWSVNSNATWLTASPVSGSGSGTVQFTAATNTSTANRSAVFTVANQPIQITQAGNIGTGCIYDFGTDQQLSYPSNITVAHTGGSGTVPVTAPGGCAWAAVSNVAWITITSGATYSGNQAVQYTVAANPGVTRSGTMTIAGMTYTVNQP